MDNPQPQLALIKDDPWLAPHRQAIENRTEWFRRHLEFIESHCGGLLHFAHAYRYFGFNYDPQKKGWWFREYAPSAYTIHLMGDFNGWDAQSHPLSKNERGDWEIFLPDHQYGRSLFPYSRIKIRIQADNGTHDRIPAYIRRVIQDPVTRGFDGQFTGHDTFRWRHEDFSPREDLTPIIYEAHVGMALEKEGVGTWREFAREVLPRIKRLGYNTLQLMAVQEHPYYGSFGYHVSNFFAPSSRFGSPDELKELIDQAHGMGIAVIMDIVHSHAVKNMAEGLSEFDGTKELYFLPGAAGWHPQWDSRLFDYGKVCTEQFLLSNIAYWLEEFRFDGFRFDGVTSMLYYNHGNMAFDSYDKYFGPQTNSSAVLYLQLANRLIRRIKPTALSVAEDMSGMPGICRKIEDGGIGFTHRLAMGIPDYWIKLLKHVPDENWNMGELYYTLTNRRAKEPVIAYAESHDQALVGDKTIAFWLMDKDMYTDMSVFRESLSIDRGIALHKMIRFVTACLGGDGYLNFMGNEFGHPEWIDFPREGNGWSYKYARRQWSLAGMDHLKYKFLDDFDEGMIAFLKEGRLFRSPGIRLLNQDEENKVLIFERAGYIFFFNFSPGRSIENYRFWVPQSGEYRPVFSSDEKKYGGFDRIQKGFVFKSFDEDENGGAFLSVYTPARTAFVLERIG